MYSYERQVKDRDSIFYSPFPFLLNLWYQDLIKSRVLWPFMIIHTCCHNSKSICVMKLCFWLRINSTFIPRHRVGLETCPKPSFENNSSKKFIRNIRGISNLHRGSINTYNGKIKKSLGLVSSFLLQLEIKVVLK